MTKEIKGRISVRVRAERNPNWRTGSWTRSDGRVMVRVPDAEVHLHPTVHHNGYIQRYVYVWNRANPGDPVRPGEIIHHRNEDPTDDRIENLQKMTQSEHASEHFRGVERSPEYRQRMSESQKARRRRERELRGR